MSAETVRAIVRNKTTDRDREFWSHVETVAEQSRVLRERALSQATHANEGVAIHHSKHTQIGNEHYTKRALQK